MRNKYKQTKLCSVLLTTALMLILLSACSGGFQRDESESIEYQNALEKLDEGLYDEAKEILMGMQKEYKLNNLLVDNMDKIETLLENTWEYSKYGWDYVATFSIFVYDETIELYTLEAEYSGETFLGTYQDQISLIDLLEDGIANVVSDERDNFTIDINNVKNGKIVRQNEYVYATYTSAEVLEEFRARIKRICKFDIPEGFEEQAVDGLDLYYVNADGSNLNVLVSEKKESDDKAFGSVTADALREALEEGFLDSLEAEVDITNVSFTQNPVDGFEAYQYTCAYALWGVEMEQFIVCVNADKLYTFTYTDTTGAWMEEFQRSGENIRFETEAP